MKTVLSTDYRYKKIIADNLQSLLNSKYTNISDEEHTRVYNAVNQYNNATSSTSYAFENISSILQDIIQLKFDVAAIKSSGSSGSGSSGSGSGSGSSSSGSSDSNLIDYSETVSEKSNLTASVSISGWTYGGVVHNPIVTGNTGNGTVTYLYKISTADDSTYTLTKPSLPGTYTIKAIIAETTNYNKAIVTNTFTIEVPAKNILSASVSMSGWTYGETASNPSVSGNTGNGEITYSYKVSTADDSTYTSTKPSNAGTYIVKAVIAETNDYFGATVTTTFTISKASLSASVSMNGWVYGNTASNPSVSGNTGNGEVTYSYKVSTADDSTYTSTKPSEVGTYTVKAVIASTTNYNGATVTTTFTISSEAAHDYSQDYLTFNITSDGNITPTHYNTTDQYQYRKNSGEWTNITSTIAVVTGDIVEFKGNTVQYHNLKFTGSTCGFTVSGNIMSIYATSDWTTRTSLGIAESFKEIFKDCTGLTTAEHLILPATNLVNSCYYGMFEGCTSLTTAPDLLSTDASTRYCYVRMFYGCTSLQYIKCLATVINYNSTAELTTDSWLKYASSTGTFIKNSSMSDWPTNDSGIPSGWTVQDAA